MRAFLRREPRPALFLELYSFQLGHTLAHGAIEGWVGASARAFPTRRRHLALRSRFRLGLSCGSRNSGPRPAVGRSREAAICNWGRGEAAVAGSTELALSGRSMRRAYARRRHAAGRGARPPGVTPRATSCITLVDSKEHAILDVAARTAGFVDMLVTALSEVIAKMRTTTACTRSIRGRRQAAGVDEGGRSANVTMANLEQATSVIHVIDAALLPR